MNDRNPAFLQRLTGAILRWADEQHRLAQDEKYWHVAQHDPRVMADIKCALARAQPESPVPASSRSTRKGTMAWLPLWGRHAVEH